MSLEKDKKAVPVSVSLNVEVRDRLDAFAEVRGCSRSRLIQELIQRHFDELDGVKRLPLLGGPDA